MITKLILSATTTAKDMLTIEQSIISKTDIYFQGQTTAWYLQVYEQKKKHVSAGCWVAALVLQQKYIE